MNEMNTLLDNIAKATIEVFQQSAELNSSLINPGNGLFSGNCAGHAESNSTRHNVKSAILR